MFLLSLIVFLCIVSFFMTWAFRVYAISRSMFDIPNSRSSHSVPTPRGGGLAIVCSFIIALIILLAVGALPSNFAYALLWAGSGVALLGFLDDRGHIPAHWRLIGHFAASIWALICLNGLPAITFFGLLLDLKWIGNCLAAFYLVWMLNLYNFMDGIDGVASIEAVCTCLAACLLYWLSGYTELIWGPMALAAATLGFLFWNFPPAKIFMGDAGSGFLGITIGIFCLQGAWVNGVFFWVWLILLGVFIVDATMTLFRRLCRGEKIYQAHRSHAYQHASRYYGKHRTVTVGVAIINVFWLLPVAMLVVSGVVDGVVGLICAYIPLVWLGLKFSAGKREANIS